MIDRDLSAASLKPAQRVFSIDAGLPFLPTLIDALMAGQFGPMDNPGTNPLALANVTILLPTRRSVMALQDLLVDRFAAPSVVLPRIRPLGDIDDADYIQAAVDAEQATNQPVTPLAIDPVDRLLLLTQLVAGFRDRLAELQQQAGIAEASRVPSSIADAAWLARDLASLLDFAATERSTWAGLHGLVPDQFASHWQLTVEFLQIISDHWPTILADRQRADIGTRRNLLLEAEARRLRDHPPDGIMIAAGSTGSVPATAELMREIATLAHGAVVLPGLDFTLSDDAFEAIETTLDGPEGPTASHPQYALKKLLSRLQIDRPAVIRLGQPTAAIASRSRCLSAAMLPASKTATWREQSAQLNTDKVAGFAGVEILEAASPREEALWIALKIRQCIAEGQSCALVTADQALGRRVVADLAHWSITIADSRGRALSDTPPAQLAKLCAQYQADPSDSHRLLAIMKHPLTRLAKNRSDWLAAVRTIERAALRGPAVGGGLEAIDAQLDALSAALEAPAQSGRNRLRGDRRRLTAADVTVARDALDRLRAALPEAPANETTSVADLAAGLATTLHKLTALADTTVAEHPGAIASGPAGRVLLQLLDQLQQTDGTGFDMEPLAFAEFLDVIFADQTVDPGRAGDPRYQILGTLESRLQSFDHVIIGSLNEGSWPQSVETDAWLSRGMRAQLNLDPPEQRIGLAGHDFCQLMGAPTLTLSRSLKQSGTPTQPARWLRRLDAFLGQSIAAEQRRISAQYRAYSDVIIDRQSTLNDPTGRPAPIPPPGHKPDVINITDVEHLVRDPYAFYAKNILKLRPMDGVAQAVGPAERGTFIHDLLDSLVADGIIPTTDALHERGRRALADSALDAATRERWRRWLHGVLRGYAQWEKNRLKPVNQRFGEIEGRLRIHVGSQAVTIAGRADRIDIFDDRSVGLYDFKTGAPPTPKQIASGFAPQLAIESSIAAAGGFDLPSTAATNRNLSVAELGFLHLTDRTVDLTVKSAFDTDQETPESIAALAVAQLHELIGAYLDPQYRFASRTRPQFESRFGSDYDHLARVQEWAQELEADE